MYYHGVISLNITAAVVFNMSTVKVSCTGHTLNHAHFHDSIIKIGMADIYGSHYCNEEGCKGVSIYSCSMTLCELSETLLRGLTGSSLAPMVHSMAKSYHGNECGSNSLRLIFV